MKYNELEVCVAALLSLNERSILSNAFLYQLIRSYGFSSSDSDYGLLHKLVFKY